MRTYSIRALRPTTDTSSTELVMDFVVHSDEGPRRDAEAAPWRRVPPG
ncbi:siderophore-interacting protein [Corynebacterium sp. zg-331]|nr:MULTISPECIES: siderophore-interacting protein [unclassified Corynebacterium]MBC3185947.1 siderophore-interacting protein [Corynebacterium sp. zg-331]MPV52438.1 hypothetical protein [Corynebacterium sp. zg331]